MAANLQLLFVQADNATSLAHKLADSMFFKRNGGVPVVENHNVRCSFGNPVSRQKLLQACSENFKKYQVKDATLKYAQHCVVEPPPTEAARMSSLRLSSLRLPSMRRPRLHLPWHRQI